MQRLRSRRVAKAMAASFVLRRWSCSRCRWPWALRCSRRRWSWARGPPPRCRRRRRPTPGRRRPGAIPPPTTRPHDPHQPTHQPWAPSTLDCFVSLRSQMCGRLHVWRIVEHLFVRIDGHRWIQSVCIRARPRRWLGLPTARQACPQRCRRRRVRSGRRGSRLLLRRLRLHGRRATPRGRPARRGHSAGTRGKTSCAPRRRWSTSSGAHQILQLVGPVGSVHAMSLVMTNRNIAPETGTFCIALVSDRPPAFKRNLL